MGKFRCINKRSWGARSSRPKKRGSVPDLLLKRGERRTIWNLEAMIAKGRVVRGTLRRVLGGQCEIPTNLIGGEKRTNTKG